MVSAADTFAILKRGVKHVNENSSMDDGGTSPFWLRAMATCSAPEKATSSAMAVAVADGPSSSPTAGVRGGAGDGGDMDAAVIRFPTAMCAPPPPPPMVARSETGNWCPRGNDAMAQSGVMLQLSLASDPYGVRIGGRMQGPLMSCGASARSPQPQKHQEVMAARGGAMNGVGRQGVSALGSMLGASGAGWHSGSSPEHHVHLPKSGKEEEAEVDEEEEEVQAAEEEAEGDEEGHELSVSLQGESLSCNAGGGHHCTTETKEIVEKTAAQMITATAAQATAQTKLLTTAQATVGMAAFDRLASGSGGITTDKLKAVGNAEVKKGVGDPNLGMQGLALVAEMFSDKEKGPKEEEEEGGRKGGEESAERKSGDFVTHAACCVTFDGPASAGIAGTGSKAEETKSSKSPELMASGSEFESSTWVRSSTRVVNGAGGSVLSRMAAERSPVTVTADAAAAAVDDGDGGPDTAGGELACEREAVAVGGAMEAEVEVAKGGGEGRRQGEEVEAGRVVVGDLPNVTAAAVVGRSVQVREGSNRSAVVSQRRKRTAPGVGAEYVAAAGEVAAHVAEGGAEQMRCGARGTNFAENGIACCDPSLEGSKGGGTAWKSENGGDEKRGGRSASEELADNSRGGAVVVGGRQRRGGGMSAGGSRSSREGSRGCVGGGAVATAPATASVRQASAAATVGASGGRGLVHNAVGKAGATGSGIDGFSLLAAAASEHLRSNGNEGETWSGLEGQRVMPRACAAVPRNGGGASSGRANGYVSERRLNAVFNRGGGSSPLKGGVGGGGGEDSGGSRGVGRGGEVAAAGSGGTVFGAGGRRSSAGGRADSAVTVGREKGSRSAMSFGFTSAGQRNQQQSNGTKRRKERRGNGFFLAVGVGMTADQEQEKSDATLEKETDATAAHSHNEPRGSEEGARGSLGNGSSRRVGAATVGGGNGGAAVWGLKRGGGGGAAGKKSSSRGGVAAVNGANGRSHNTSFGRPLGGGGGAPPQAQPSNREAEIKKRLIARTGDVAAQPAKRREVNREGDRQRAAELSDDDEATEDDDLAPAGGAEGGSLENNVGRGARAVVENGRHVEAEEGPETMDSDDAEDGLDKQQHQEGISAAPRRDPSLAEYDVGDVVWAKSGQKHDPFWPAKVVDPLHDAPPSVRQRGQAQRLCVMYFGPTANKRRDRDYAWVKEGQIFPFSDYLHKFNGQMLSNRNRPKDFRAAVNEALEAEAGYDEIQGMPQDMRSGGPACRAGTTVKGSGSLVPKKIKKPSMTPVDEAKMTGNLREQEEQGEKNGSACESCGVALLPTLTGKSKKPNPEDGRFCRSCLKFIQAKQHCGVCKKIWLPNTKGNYVQCDQCKFWIHNECDFYIKKHFKKITQKNETYLCPTCREKLEGQKTTGKRKREEREEEWDDCGPYLVPEHLPVMCEGVIGHYLPRLHRVLCQCKTCGKGKEMGPSEWERHAGSRKKKWKESIRVVNLKTPLIEWLTFMEDGGAIGLAFNSGSVAQAQKTGTRDLASLMKVPYEPIVMRWTVERCAVCWQVDEYDVNKIIVCDRCHVAVHEECYGTKSMDKKGPWVCRLCETPDIERECCLCPVRGGAMKPTSVDGLWAHLLCAWWTPNVCIEDTRKMEPIEGLTDVNIAYFKMTCSICKQPHGACIQCDLRGCCVSYHPMCARRCGYFMEMKPRTKDGMFVKMEMTSFCAKHKTPHPESAGMETLHPESFKPKSRAFGDRRKAGGGGCGDVFTDDEEHSSNEGGADDSKGFSAARCTPYETDANRRASRKQAFRRQPVPYRVRGISWHTAEQVLSLRPATQNEEEGFSLHARLEIAQKSESRRLCFGQSAIHGWGLMARRAIRNGEIVGEYRGVLVGGVVANMREERYQRQGKHCYLFKIDEENVIDATEKGNRARLINHSCEPNCHAKILEVDGQNRIILVARKDISTGEELTYDYRFDEEDQNKVPCRCGARNCRQFMN